MWQVNVLFPDVERQSRLKHPHLTYTVCFHTSITREVLTSPGGGAQRSSPKVKNSYNKSCTVRKRRRIFLAPFIFLSKVNRQFPHLKILDPPNLSLIVPQEPHVLLVYSSETIMTLQWGYSLAL